MNGLGATVGIAGAGAFGSALARVVAARGGRVALWGEEAQLAGVTLPPGVTATSKLAELAAGARLIVLAVRSTRVAQLARALGDVVDGRHMIVHAVGADPGQRVSELLRRETAARRIGVLAGPAMARDLDEGRPCAVVVASAFSEVVERTQAELATPPVLRVYGSTDLLGVELASALSGALTVALGLVDGIALGAGPRAVLVCRGVAEASRLLGVAGASERTFGGLAGLGNLLVRAGASSAASDDYRLGLALARPGGQGEQGGRETEGTRAARGAAELGRKSGVRTPIMDAVVSITYQGVPVRDAARRLLESSAPPDEEA